jgi:hypothetical protein
MLTRVDQQPKDDSTTSTQIFRLFREAPQNGAGLPPQSVIACLRAFLNRTAASRPRDPLLSMVDNSGRHYVV